MQWAISYRFPSDSSPCPCPRAPLTTTAAGIKAALDKAAAAASSGNLDAAEDICAAVTAKNSSSFDALYALAGIQSARRRYLDAIGNYGRALETLRPRISALTHRGTALHQLGRFDEAVASYDDALSLRPLVAEVLFKRAVAHYAIGDIRRAAADCQQALNLQPDHSDALKMLGRSE